MDSKKTLPNDAAWLLAVRIELGGSLPEGRAVATYTDQTGKSHEMVISLEQAHEMLGTMIRLKQKFPVKVH